MNKFMCKCAEKCAPWAPTVLRIAVGIVFAAHGWQKLGMGVENVAGFFGSLGIPAATAAAYLVTYLELLGGIALILGLFTHWLAKLFAIEMATAFFLVHIKNGIFVQDGGFELVFLLFAGAVSLMMTGAGKLSLDSLIFKKREQSSTPSM